MKTLIECNDCYKKRLVTYSEYNLIKQPYYCRKCSNNHRDRYSNDILKKLKRYAEIRKQILSKWHILQQSIYTIKDIYYLRGNKMKIEITKYKNPNKKSGYDYVIRSNDLIFIVDEIKDEDVLIKLYKKNMYIGHIVKCGCVVTYHDGK